MRLGRLLGRTLLLALTFGLWTSTQCKAETCQYEVAGCNLQLIHSPAATTQRLCYHRNTLRSALVLSECSNADRSGALCYPPCRDGYSGVGPVCWQQCAAGYSDDGVTRRRNADIRGSDNGDCPWYDKCGLVSARGCSKCPEGYHNDGCTRRIDAHIYGKDSYGRGVGWPMSCSPGKEQIAALCYGDCSAGWHKAGIYCDEDKETCDDVPVNNPCAPLECLCFKMENSANSVEPCFGWTVFADSPEHGKKLAENCKGGYEPTSVPCARIDNGTVCSR